MGEPKYRDKKGSKYPDIESFHNWTSLPEIKIQESQRKIKGNTISPWKQERTIKVSVTNKNYQTNKEEEEKEKEHREEKHKEW